MYRGFEINENTNVMLRSCRHGYWAPHERASSIYIPMRIVTSRNDCVVPTSITSLEINYKVLRRPTQHIFQMGINMNQARKSGSPPSTSSAYLNIAAFDSMAYPVTGDMYTDYYNDSIMGSNNQGYSDMRNVRPLEK